MVDNIYGKLILVYKNSHIPGFSEARLLYQTQCHFQIVVLMPESMAVIQYLSAKTQMLQGPAKWLEHLSLLVMSLEGPALS